MDGWRLQPIRRAMLVAGTVACAAPAIVAQPAKRLPKLGYLGATPKVLRSNPYFAALLGELEKLGWVEGKGFLFEDRFADNDYSKLDALARDLVAQRIDVAFAPTDAELRALFRAAPPDLPIVVAVATDPVDQGYAKSLGRPGGNVTGMTFEQDVGISARLVQFMKEGVPQLKHYGIVLDRGQPGLQPYLDVQLQAARQLGIAIEVVEVMRPDAFEAAFASLVRANVQAIHWFGSPMTYAEMRRIVALARRHRLPDIGIFAEAVELGGLISYGVDLVDNWRRSATYIDKILKGAKPAELPFQQPTKYDLVINLKTAKELGLKVPQSLLVQATRFVE